MSSILKVNELQDTTGTSAMTIDSSGRIVHPQKPAFRIRFTSTSGFDYTSGVTLSGSTHYQSSTLVEQGGNNFNHGTGRYVAPVTGFYFFSVGVRYDAFSGSYFYVTLENPQQTIGRHLTSLQSTYLNAEVTGLCKLNAGEYMKVVLTSSGDSSVNVNDDSYFAGFLI